MSKQDDLVQLRIAVQSMNEQISRIESAVSKISSDTRDFAADAPAESSDNHLSVLAASSIEDPQVVTNDYKFERLFSAYEVMAGRLEALAPNRWRADDIVRVLKDQLSLPPTTQEIRNNHLGGATAVNSGSMTPAFVNNNPARAVHDRVRIGIASMAGREEGLRQVLEILGPQADEIFVYLNDLNSVPSSLPQKRNVQHFIGPDVGDRGKFKFMEGFEGYYLTCDDDIAYAPFHVQSIIDGIERYKRKAIVGWHGSIFKPDFQEFYNPKYRQVLSFRHERGRDTPVHLLGTGVCGFHTSSIDIRYEDFIHANMADVFLAIAAKSQKVGMIVLKHKKDIARPLEVGPSISSVSLKKDAHSKEGLDVAATVSELVRSQMPWTTHEVKPIYNRTPFSVAFIGRTDKDRWKKGGILKSAHLTVDLLNRFDVETILEDIETGDPQGLHGHEVEIVMLYVGDPDRPDFKRVEELVKFHADLGRHVIVNLSFNGKKSRSEFIVNKILEWRRDLGERVWLMVFTDSVLSTPDLAQVKDYSIVIPKTIALPDDPCVNFGDSKGIFLGDIAKMSDDYLLDYPAAEWIASIRESLPGVPLYAVQQYKPKYDLELDIDEIWPFLRNEEFANKISRSRLMVSMVKYATFEMVPLEVASLGIPVVYPEMPQSLSEHLGLSGFQVTSPEQLSRVLPTLYYDPIVWSSQSRASIERAWSSEMNRVAGQMYLRLIDLLRRA